MAPFLSLLPVRALVRRHWALGTCLTGGLLLLPALLRAQAPTITALSPTRNLRNAPLASNVTVRFNQPMSTAAATAGAVKVFSQQRGGRMGGTQGGTATVTINTISFNPTADFKPGETVYVSTTTAAQSNGGVALAKGKVHQFTTAVSGTGEGVFPTAHTTSVNNLLLTNLAVGDVNGDTFLDVVATASSGVYVYFRRALSNVVFLYQGASSVGNTPSSVVLGDVDGDGDLDIVAANYGVNGTGNTVKVQLNGGDASGSSTGVFSNGSTVSVGTGPTSVAVGDADGDGDLDLFTANAIANTVSVRLNGGDATGSNTGTFSNGTDCSVGTNPRKLAVGDVDSDGDLDLLTVNYGVNGAGNTVSVRLNGGDASGSNTGIFANGTDPSVGTGPINLAVADVDGDSDLDLLTANYGVSGAGNTVSVRLNGGDASGSNTGVFSNGTECSVDFGPNSVAVGDVDGDGDLDLVTANYGVNGTANTASVRLNGGNATGSNTGIFFNGSNPSVPGSPRSVTMGDVNSDGALDLLMGAGGGFALLPNGQTVPPALTSFTPTSGPVGTSITITGSNLGDATNVSVNGTAGTITANTATSVTFTVGAGTTTGAVSVTTAGGTATGGTFTVLLPPVITTFSPTRNLRNAARTSNIIVNFDQTMKSGAATAGAVKVFSQQRGGRMGGSAGVGSNIISFNPITDFKPGETVYVSTTTAAQSSGGVALAAGEVHQFTAAAGVGPGYFLPGSTVAVGAFPGSVAVADVDNDGDLDMLTANVGANTVSVRFNGGAGAFSGSTSVAVGDSPKSVAVADVDNDGDLDLLTANEGANTVSVRLNNGSGTFSGSTDYAVGTNPNSVAVGDVDADGDLDVLVANYGSAFAPDNTVSVLLNAGNGTFAEATAYTVGDQPISVAVADVDADGDLDLLTANYGSLFAPGNTVSVRLNNGSGAFSGTTDYTVGDQPISVAVADVDADGDLDFLTANLSGNTVSVRRNDGSGTFTGTADFAVGTSPSSLALGDVDGDGDLDLQVTQNSTNKLSVYFNDGTGTFADGTDYTVGASPSSVAVGDLDGDGDLDILTANYTANTVSVQFNAAVAPTITGLAPARNYAFAARTSAVGVTFSLPMRNSLTTQQSVRVFSQQHGGRMGGTTGGTATVSGNTVAFAPTTPFRAGETVYVTTTTGATTTTSGTLAAGHVHQFTAAAAPAPGTLLGDLTTAVGVNPGSVAVGDVDNDGDLDLLTANLGANTVSVRLNDGTGTYAGEVEYAVDAVPYSVVLCDVNGDGHLDFLTANQGANTVSCYFNDGTGAFLRSFDHPVGTSPYSIAVGDLNADGFLDLLTANYTANTVSVRLNDSNGGFMSFTNNPAVGTGPVSVAVADVDADGDLDLVTANYNANTVSVRLNDGSGNFSGSTDYAVGLRPQSIAVGDVDGDGDLDLLTPNRNANTVSVLLNNGSGTFTPGTSPTVGNGPQSITLGDVDGDGDLDLLTANITANTVSIRLNNSSGLFSGGTDPVVGTQPASIAVADVDADGDLDMLTANLGDNTVSVRVNATAPTITVLTPTRNLRNAPPATNVAVTFSQPMLNNSATQQSVRVFSQQHGGQRSGAATVSGNTVTFDPTADFRPGETVYVTTTTGATATNRVKLAAGRVHQFTAAAGVGPGVFSGGSEAPVQDNARGITLGDVDGDGDLDLLTTNDVKVGLCLNSGNGTYGNFREIEAGVQLVGVTLADVDGDGDLDLLTHSDGSVSVRLNDGNGTFGGGSDLAVDFGTTNLAVGDIDGDGDLDLISANYASTTISVRFNNGNGTFGGGYDAAIGVPDLIALGDLDGDGDLDLIIADKGNNPISVRFNDGTGVFSGGSNFAAGTGRNCIVLGDVDADGDLDLLTTNPGFNTVGVYRNDGSGAFSARTDVSVGIYPTSVALGDVDGDGDLDLATSNFNPNSITDSASVRLNDGSGTFGGGTNLAVGNGPYNVALGDVDGDGDLDLLTGNYYEGTSVRLNQVQDLVVSTAQSISGTYNSVTITGTGTATLSGPLTVNTTLTVQTGGQLNTACQAITGAATFTLQAGATLRICDAGGISTSGATGAVQVTGTRTFASDATYVYNGTVAQGTGNGLPATVRELEINNTAGVTLTQASGVTNVLRLTAGTLSTVGQVFTLRSTATRTAYAVHSGGLTSGAITVQRYVGGPTAVGYRHLSSPVQYTLVSDLTTPGFTPKVNVGYNTLPYVAPPAATFPNVLGYDETRGGTVVAYRGFTTGYYSPTKIVDPLISGRGWSVAMGGGLTLDFVDELTTGDVPQTLTVTGTNTSPNTQKAGWHLLGNPYAQPIDWDLATVPPGMNSSISVYRTTGGNNGVYLTRANGIGSLADGIVPLGQAFFARATSATTFTFSNAMRVESNPATVARPSAETRPVLGLTLTDAQGQGDETFVYTEAGATAEADARFDGFKPSRNLGVPTLATLIGQQEAAVNGLPETVLTQPTTVELVAVLPTAGTYSLAVGQLVNFGGTSVELLDRLTGTRYDLVQQPTITLTATHANEEVTGRFALLLNGQRITGDNSSSFIPHSSFTLFPNPASGGAEVRVMGVAVGEVVRLLDATGRVVRTSTTAVLNTRELAAGVYIVRAADGRTTRLVVE